MHKATPSGGYLNASMLGTGKTLCTVQYILEQGFKSVLLIVPLNTRVSWERTFRNQGWEHPIKRVESVEDLEDFGTGVYIIGRELFALLGSEGWSRKEVKLTPKEVSEIKKTGELPKRLVEEGFDPDLTYTAERVVKTGKTFLSWRIREQQVDWSQAPNEVTVYDEVHRLQNRKSTAFKSIEHHQPKMKIGLSGTPSGNKFQGFYAVCKWLWPKVMPGSFWNWSTRWAHVVFDRFAGKKVEGERNPGEFVKTLPGYYRLESKLDVKAEPVQLFVELSPKQRQLYNQMEEQALAWLEENPLVAEVPIAQRTRLRQITLGVPYINDEDEVDFRPTCQSSKFDALKEFLADHEEEAVLILCNSAKFARIVAKRLGKKAAAWTGQTTAKERESLQERFGRDVQYLVATIAAIGEGVDGLQLVSNTVVWLSKDENGLLNEQAAGRLLRGGQTKNVVEVEIIALNTYDDAISSRLAQRQAERQAELHVEKV